MNSFARHVFLGLGLISAGAVSLLVLGSFDAGASIGGDPAPPPSAAPPGANSQTLPTPSITSVKQNDTDAFPNEQQVNAGQQKTLYGNAKAVTIRGSLAAQTFDDKKIGIYATGYVEPVVTVDAAAQWTAKVPIGKEGTYKFKAAVLKTANGQQTRSEFVTYPYEVDICWTPPQVLDVDISGLQYGSNISRIKVIFTKNKLQTTADENVGVFKIRKTADGAEEVPTESTETYTPGSDTAILAIQDMAAGQYELTVEHVVDSYGNKLLGNDPKQEKFTERIFKPVGGEEPTVRPGIVGPTGPYIPYQEYTEPRKYPDGFNPSDKVETRVARLYYFRDAHRVAQIVNRNSRSYNRAGVDMARQLADRARTVADQTTDARQQAERAAIEAARKARLAERKLEYAQQLLQQTLNDIRRLNGEIDKEKDKEGAQKEKKEETPLEKERDNRQAAADTIAAQARAFQDEVQRLRDEEVRLSEQAQQAEAREKRAREDQFRREVAAGHADPDTYAPGVPRSDDPVEQVSISVIGEGLIQLRGPLKGINVIRTMINQIDAPVGQVRIAVHTFQINGEHGDRMEKVSDKMQKFIDQPRFLTLRSAEMLRSAIVQVAAERAAAAAEQYPGATQTDRDQRYLYAFFGQDFVDELATMDSEFLHTGNKLLSLHSMDTTSLSSALFLLALAKDSVRTEIISRFEGMVAAGLPAAEERYIQSGAGCPTRCDWRGRPKYCLLAGNASFESLRGFFAQDSCGTDDTMTPIQREFIRLAQIFKSRLITEMELRQRVMERAVIEQRFADYRKALRESEQDDNVAKSKLKVVRKSLAEQRANVLKAFAPILAFIDLMVAKQAKAVDIRDRLRRPLVKEKYAILPLKDRDIRVTLDSEGNYHFQTTEDASLWEATFLGDLRNLEQISQELGRLRLTGETEKSFREMNSKMNEVRTSVNKKGGSDAAKAPSNRRTLKEAYEKAVDVLTAFASKGAEIQQLANEFLAELNRPDLDVTAVHKKWLTLKRTALPYLSPELLAEIEAQLEAADEAMAALIDANGQYLSAVEIAEQSRRPLDHKKFLDMLVDDIEDKYIELLEGTRAQTANIDNYIKRVATALDDDFNTQFYLPAMRGARQASRYWDVTFGQVETTSILANNRAFAKVDPNATMEFDLPERDILINEAMNGALAVYKDVGALVNDPSFLALARAQAGGSTASPPAGSTGGFATVRSVLPGLGSSTAENILAQGPAAEPRFGAAMEALIPDPAIYSFETGTGMEIRPVIQPDGQAVVFHFNYMYTTNIREPVRADEKHLGRVKRHFIDTDVQLSNYELREVSRYQVALKASRTARGVPLLEDIPIAGVLFRPLPQQESSLQQNLIYAQATIFPTLFDLMGLRWAPAVADLDPLRLENEEFIVRNRHRMLQNRVYDYSSAQVDEFLRVPEADRRPDLYRTQESVPALHPNGYQGPGLDYRDSKMEEGYQPERAYPQQKFIPGASREGSPLLPGSRSQVVPEGTYIEPLSVPVIPEPQAPAAPLPPG